MRARNIIPAVSALILLTVLFPLSTQAAVFSDDNSAGTYSGEYFDGIPDEMLDEQYEAAGADSVYDALPEDVRYSLRRAGIDIRSAARGQEPDLDTILQDIENSLADAARAPLASCCAAFAVIMVCAALGGVVDQPGGSPASGTLATVVTAASCIVVVTPAAMHMTRCADALRDTAVFARAVIPVMCSFVLISRGGFGSQSAAALMTAAAGMTGLAADSALLELLRVYLALSCVSAVSGILRLDGLLAVIEKNIKWALTFAATVFLGLLAVSCASAAAFDQVRYKAFKLVVSGSVPVIGGTVGDALGSLRSCVLILKTSVGSFGMLAAMFILLPPIIRTVLWSLALELCAAAAGMFGVKPAEKLLTCCAGAMNVLLSVLVFTGVVLLGTLACVSGGGSI